MQTQSVRARTRHPAGLNTAPAVIMRLHCPGDDYARRPAPRGIAAFVSVHLLLTRQWVLLSNVLYRMRCSSQVAQPTTTALHCNFT